MNGSRVALVTGASRGIGRAVAVELAKRGFDVAITARTVHEGEGRTEATSVRSVDPIVAIPGSLDSTASEIEDHRRRALAITMDVTDAATVVSAPARVIGAWGRIDVLVNNAIFKGAGTMDPIRDLTPSAMTQLMTANYVHQVLLTQQVVPQMIERGSGRIINIVSGSARLDPQAPAGEGGWGIAYSASKAAFARVAGGLNAEFAPTVLSFNVDPGHVITETTKALRRDDVFSGYGEDSASSTARMVAWLATSDRAHELLGKWIYAPTTRVESH